MGSDTMKSQRIKIYLFYCIMIAICAVLLIVIVKSGTRTYAYKCGRIHADEVKKIEVECRNHDERKSIKFEINNKADIKNIARIINNSTSVDYMSLCQSDIDIKLIMKNGEEKVFRALSNIVEDIRTDEGTFVNRDERLVEYIKKLIEREF